MLASLAGILRYTGSNGLIGLCILLQVGMYKESTNVACITGSKTIGERLERWWWFATVFAGTTVRHIVDFGGVVGKGSMVLYDLGVFGMVCLGLVGGVGRMAVEDDAGEESFRKWVGRWAGSNFALVFLLGQSSFWIKTVKTYGLSWILYPALLIIVNDTMAYVFGVLFGKHKLIPKLSPKKTVEGFIGAGVSTLAISIPLLDLFIKKGWFTTPAAMNAAAAVDGSGVAGTAVKTALNTLLCPTNLSIIPQCRRQHALVLALYASIIAPFGGFLASAVKRSYAKKDFGSFIPGHGGVIDRFDCQIVTAPFVYLYLKACEIV